MPLNLKSIYQKMEGKRKLFLQYADETARMFAPDLAPRGHNKAIDEILERPYTSRGIKAVRRLRSFLVKIMMPPGVRWHEIGIGPRDWTILSRIVRGDIDVLMSLASRFELRTQDTLDSIRVRGHRERISPAIRRNLVEGSTACANLPSGLRFYPLRSHVVEREDGQVRIMLCMDQREPDPREEESSTRNTIETIYTMVDYEKNEIWRQKDNEAARRVEDELPQQWFCFVPEIPDVGDYPMPYSWNYLRLATQVDHAEKSLAEAMAIASWDPIMLRTGTTAAKNPDAVRTKRTGETLVSNPGDVYLMEKQRNIAGWGFVAQMRNDDAIELSDAFAGGVKDRPELQGAPATAILAVINELGDEGIDLVSAYENTLQKPLVRSEMALFERVDPLLPALPGAAAELIQVMITTGPSALEQQRAMGNFVGVLGALKSLDERFVVNGKPIADELARQSRLKAEGWYGEISEEQMALQQLAAMQEQEASQPKSRTSSNGQGPRRETIMTAGGPQPPQPPPPVPGS